MFTYYEISLYFAVISLLVVHLILNEMISVEFFFFLK